MCLGHVHALWVGHCLTGYKGHSCTTARSTGEHKQGASRRTQTSASGTTRAGFGTARQGAQCTGAQLAGTQARLDKAHSALFAETDAVCATLDQEPFASLHNS